MASVRRAQLIDAIDYMEWSGEQNIYIEMTSLLQNQLDVKFHSTTDQYKAAKYLSLIISKRRNKLMNLHKPEDSLRKLCVSSHLIQSIRKRNMRFQKKREIINRKKSK